MTKHGDRDRDEIVADCERKVLPDACACITSHRDRLRNRHQAFTQKHEIGSTAADIGRRSRRHRDVRLNQCRCIVQPITDHQDFSADLLQCGYMTNLVSRLRAGDIHLVITDWEMPEMNGLELCRAIRSEDFAGYVFVIMLTSREGGQQRIDGIHAGADAFLMPSQYEPCGLNQLYSLRYGTVPIVRATGGLADTVADASDINMGAGRATGFSFIPYHPNAFRDAIDRCLRLDRERPQLWRRVQETGMRQDWSWSRSAAEYERRYRALLEAL